MSKAGYIILGEVLMEKVIKEKLEALVALMNDPDPEITVVEKEVKGKLEKILELLNNPEEIEIQRRELKEKFEKVLVLVSDTMVIPDVDFEYCIPEAETIVGTSDISTHPYILLTYIVNGTKRTRKVSLGNTAFQSTPEDLAKHVILAIEEFKDEIDDIRMG